MVERTRGRTTYTVDFKLTDESATNNFLEVLARVEHRYGPDHPVVIYLDPDVPIGEIWDVDGTAGKAQLRNLRFFVYLRGEQTLTEIKRTQSGPFTTNPAN